MDGTNGGLKGDMNHIEWRYFKPEQAPERHLVREPLPGRAYCSEKLKWHTGQWDLPKSQSGWFAYMAMCFYKNLYDALTIGTPLEVTPEQVRQQIAVIEECHRQNPLGGLA